MECRTVLCVWFDREAPQNCTALNDSTLESGCPEPDDAHKQEKNKGTEWKPKPLTPEEEAWNARTKEGCKGLIYRCKMNVFINGNGEYVYQERMRPRLKMSCKGCEHCGYLQDYLHELEWSVEIEDIEHGALYKLIYIPDPPDYWSGISEDGELKFVKIKEK